MDTPVDGNIDFLVHLPLLRVEEDMLAIAGMRLHKLPFERYNRYSARAFEEQASRFESTAPVFLSGSIPLSSLPPGWVVPHARATEDGTVELKIPSTRLGILNELGLAIVPTIHELLSIPVWTSLLLAAPDARLVSPLWSQTFVGNDSEFAFDIGGEARINARIQGEADHEYLFLPETASEPLSASVIADADAIMSQLDAWERVPELHAALDTLRLISSPVLSPQDRLVMAVLALESLLLPEIRTQLKKTFTRRLSSLLAASAPPDVETLALIPKLYSLRSESVHGAPLIDGTDALVHGSAERLLAFAIRSIGALVSKGRSISDVRQLLDEEHSAPILQVPLLLGTRPRAANDRFQRGQPSDVFAMTSSMAAEDGQLIAWAPLIGLGWGLANVTGALMGTEKGPALMPLEPQEFMDLEERDIRRDYLAGFVAQGHQMSVLFILAGVGESADDSAAIARLNRQRDLAVTALRLAGYSMFRDPELFGSVVFEGKRRLRQATVLRQTVAEGIRHPAEQHFSPADQPRVAAHWDSLARYDRNGQCPSIEYLLSLYRRTFDDFLTAHQRVLALFSLMESMIGRFRPPDDALQLDAIVAALLPQGEDTEWLRLDGRRTRNAFAHGDELSAEEVEVVANSMTRLVSGLLAAMIETWNAASEESRSRRPSALLIARAASERG